LVAAASAACSSADSATTTGNDALINGKDASASDLPGILYIKSGCTATKVAPRILMTAAHCVLDTATTDSKYPAGSTLSWSLLPSSGWTDAKVLSSTIHPLWVSGCDATYCALSTATQRMDAPDIAVIELTDEIAGVTTATIGADALVPGDAVTIVGYGCTVGALMADTRPSIGLSEATTTTIPASDAVHDGSAVKATDVPQVAGIYSLTPGPGLKAGSAGLCPGDSGGPLYAKQGGKMVVVGINSNYTFVPDTQDQVGLPVTNWHTRLDPGSRHHVAAWLASVGVGASANGDADAGTSATSGGDDDSGAAADAAGAGGDAGDDTDAAGDDDAAP
jgi:hypothetical protein